MTSARLYRAVLVACLLCSFEQVVSAQYSGPSILSRGGNQPGRRGRAPINFTGYVGSGYRYDTGLILVNREESGVDVGNSHGYNADS